MMISICRLQNEKTFGLITVNDLAPSYHHPLGTNFQKTMHTCLGFVLLK